MRFLTTIVFGLLPFVAHGGEWVADGAAGVGVSTGRYAYDGPAAYGTGDVHENGTIGGAAFSVSGFFGRSVSDGIALGVGVDATYLLAGTIFRYTDINSGSDLAVTAEAILRSKTLVWRVGAGYGVASFSSGSTFAVFSPENVDLVRTVAGPVGRVSVAFAAADHLDLALEVRSGYLFADSVSYVPILLLTSFHIR
jgi:hypothetical protein